MSPSFDARSSIRTHLVVAISALMLLVAGVGGWAATTKISGAIMAQGQLVVESQVKRVQHPTGGVVGELNVREGTRVKAGDILIRLDDTQIRASLGIVTKALDELAARGAREEAERDGRDEISFPPGLDARREDPSVAALVLGETRLFQMRRLAREGQKLQLREQVEQLRSQIVGLTEQEGAKTKEIGWVTQELKGIRDLWQKKLIQFNRVTSLERESARLGGERGVLISSIAQARGRIAEIELRMIQIDEDLRTEVGKDLAEIRGRTSEYVERQIAAVDQLRKIDVRAPADGRVHQLTVHNVGAVVSPQGEPIMLIVPDNDELAVEAKVQPQDIDQLRVGLNAHIRFPAFNQRTTPEIEGELSLIPADVSVDPRTGASSYLIRIRIPDAELAKLEGMKLIPGMPAEAFIETSARTVISYLMKPMDDQIRKAFREK
jgi:HlyD family secretion protein